MSKSVVKIGSGLTELSPYGDNLGVDDVTLVSLRSELESRQNFCGLIDFEGVKFDMMVPSSVGNFSDVTEYFTVDDKNYFEEIRREVYDPSKKMKLLKAVTGFGKTTEFPLLMYRAKPDSLVIVIEPNDILALSVYKYLKGMQKQVHYLSPTANSRVPSQGVVYTSIRTFLSMLKKIEMDIPGFVILQIDESHVETPEYDTLYMLIQQGVLNVDKILLTSATHKGNMIHEKRMFNSITDIELDVDNKEFSEEFVLESMDDGFLAAENIMGSALVFLPNCDLCEKVVKTYRQYGVNCRALTEYSTFEDVEAARKFLMSSNPNAPRILVCTSVLETGITLPVNTVIDLSLKEEVYFDVPNNRFVRTVRGISEAEAMQRRGRCGRISSGTYKYVKFWRDVTYTKPRPDIYTLLWFNVFGFTLPPKRTNKRLLDVVGITSSAKAACILRTGLHPLYLLPYFDKSGFAYSNTLNMLTKLSNIKGLQKVDVYLDVEDTNWHDVRLKLPTGLSVVKIPYPCDSYQSNILAGLSLEMSKSGNFSDRDVISNEVYSHPIFSNALFDEPDDLSYYEPNFREVKNGRPKYVDKMDSGYVSVRPEVNHHNNYTSGDMRFVPPASRAFSSASSNDENSVVQNKLDEMSKLLERFEARISNYQPPKSPMPFTVERKARRESLIAKAKLEGKLLDIRYLKEDQLIMPLGCKSIGLCITPDCEDFVKSVLKGKFDAKPVPISELKQYCIYLCQYYNYAWTEQAIKRIAMEKAKKRTNMFTVLFSNYGKLKHEYESLKDTTTALQKVIPCWKRLGLYLIPFNHGPDKWMKGYENLFVNSSDDEGSDSDSFH